MATDTIGLCTPQNAERTAAAMPDIDYHGTPALVMLAYDQTVDQTEYWLHWMPEDYGSGGLTCEVLWSFAGTSTNNFGCEIGFARIQPDTDDFDALSFASNQTGTWAHNGTDGGVNQDTITFTNGQIDGIVAGEFFLVRLVRNASVGTDLAGDVLLKSMVIRET